MKNILLRKIVCAVRMCWFGFCHSDILTEDIFKSMVKLFEFIFKCIEDDKPYSIHLSIGENRLASLWIYPRIKNPIDRITDLQNEIDSLKIEINNLMKQDAP